MLSRILFISYALMLSSCSTIEIWKKPYYVDEVAQFLITEKGEYLVFVSEEYHYIFNDQSLLKNILNWDYRHLIEADIKNKFILSKNNEITGSVELLCECNKVGSMEVSWMKKEGFQWTEKRKDYSSASSTTKYFSKTINLKGTRYLSNDLDLSRYKKLNQKYFVNVETDHTLSGAVGRALLTPLTLAVDGGASISFLSFAALAAPVLYSEKAGNELYKKTKKQ